MPTDDPRVAACRQKRLAAPC